MTRKGTNPDPDLIKFAAKLSSVEKAIRVLEDPNIMSPDIMSEGLRGRIGKLFERHSDRKISIEEALRALEGDTNHISEEQRDRISALFKKTRKPEFYPESRFSKTGSKY